MTQSNRQNAIAGVRPKPKDEQDLDQSVSQQRPAGFAEVAPNFLFDATINRRPIKPAITGQVLDEDWNTVKDLFRDAGMVPPPRPAEMLNQADVQQPFVAEPITPTRARELLPAAGFDQALKRIIDVSVSTLALILLAPLMGFISLLLLRERGPVLYVQSRIGRERKRFTCLKFRSMRPDAEDRLRLLLACDPAARAEWRVHQKISNDPRITPIGRLLRESSLDELPQLFNVLRGEMSLVGPRPIVAPEVPGYDADHAYFNSAAFADYAKCRPGITGLWQISGRHRNAYLDRIRLDRKYTRDWSLWLDLRIIWRTFWVVLSGSGR